MKFAIVVACDELRGIGRRGELPWRVPRDMAHFVRTTTEAPAGRKNAVIMGRVTWESIPDRFRPLRDRHNIVMTRRAEVTGEGAAVCGSLPHALEIAVDLRAFELFIIGGADVYEQALAHPGCQTLYVTRIDGQFDCDRFLPDWQRHGFRLEEVTESGESGGHGYHIERWVKA